MSRPFHLTLTDAQFAYLSRASDRTSLAVAELIRRAIDEKYHPSAPRHQPGSEFTVAVWRRDEAAPARRHGVTFEN